MHERQKRWGVLRSVGAAGVIGVIAVVLVCGFVTGSEGVGEGRIKITPKYNGKRQEFRIKKRVVTSLRLTALVPDNPGSYAAFVEVEAWGKPAP